MPVSVFDVDGCIADTISMVRLSYSWVIGRAITTSQASSPWDEWLPDMVGAARADDVRKAKTLLYLHLLRTSPPRRLPAGDLAGDLLRSGEEVYAISAAKASITPFVLAAVYLGGLPIIPEVKPCERPAVLSALTPCGTYYDDNRATCASVNASTGWTAIHV